MSPGAAGGPGHALPKLRHPPVTPAGIWQWGQQGPNPPQSLVCCTPTLATLQGSPRSATGLPGPRDTAPVTDWGSSSPNQTHPWVGGGRRWGRGGASPSRRYIESPPVLALSFAPVTSPGHRNGEGQQTGINSNIRGSTADALGDLSSA